MSLLQQDITEYYPHPVNWILLLLVSQIIDGSLALFYRTKIITTTDMTVSVISLCRVFSGSSYLVVQNAYYTFYKCCLQNGCKLRFSNTSVVFTLYSFIGCSIDIR